MKATCFIAAVFAFCLGANAGSRQGSKKTAKQFFPAPSTPNFPKTALVYGGTPKGFWFYDISYDGPRPQSFIISVLNHNGTKHTGKVTFLADPNESFDAVKEVRHFSKSILLKSCHG
jgi:hypothetical protein